MPKVLQPVDSPFRFRLDRRNCSALVEAWIVLSKQDGNGNWVRVEGPYALNSYKRKVSDLHRKWTRDQCRSISSCVNHWLRSADAMRASGSSV